MLQSRLVMRVVSKVTASYSVQLIDWMMPPSVWLRMPSGLTASPLSIAATARSGADAAALAVDLDFDRDRAVGGEVLVAREGEAAPAPALLLVARPAEALGGRADHVARARVLEVPQPELDRIGLRRARELVHEALDREHVV